MSLLETEAEALRLARQGLGHEDLSKRLKISEYDARVFVFGKGAAMRWLRRQPEAYRKVARAP